MIDLSNSNIYQQTISEPIIVKGIGLHSGINTIMKLLPADIDYGIKFIRGVCSSRKLRRAYGVPFNFAQHIPTYQQFMDSRKM